MGNQFHKLQQQRNNSQSCIMPNVDHSIKFQALKQSTFAAPIAQYLTKNTNLTSKITDSKHYKILEHGFYVGTLSQSDQPQGYGKLTLSNGSLLIGKFQKGKVNGQGAFIMPDGTCYEGNFKDNNAQGKGKYQSILKTYEGQFKNNLFDGKGKLFVKEKKSYQIQGQFQKSEIKNGKMIWTDQKQGRCQYIGQFKYGKFHGKGILTSKLGKYEGTFQNGKKSGQGTFEYTLGLYYKGGYKNNQKHGVGTIYNPQQVSKKAIIRQESIAYTGQFENGMPNGKGAIYDPQQKKLKYAIYKNGVPNQQISKISDRNN